VGLLLLRVVWEREGVAGSFLVVGQQGVQLLLGNGWPVSYLG
jgi:hypothetical protein